MTVEITIKNAKGQTLMQHEFNATQYFGWLAGANAGLIDDGYELTSYSYAPIVRKLGWCETLERS